MQLPSSPAFSIGNSKRVAGKNEQTPGPGAYRYEVDLRKSPPRAVIGTADKNAGLRTSSESPGPGNYEVRSRLGSAPRAILMSRKTEMLDDHRPGPGAYAPKVPTEHLAYTFGLKLAELQSKDLPPGPGAYDPKCKEISPRTVYFPHRFGRSSREILNRTLDEPGPASYRLNETLSGPRFAFRRASKQGNEGKSSQTPGPGSYNISGSLINRSTTASLTPRRPTSSLLRLQIPGPAAYSPSNSSFTPAYTIGKSMKLDFKSRAKTPSPADYAPRPQFRAGPVCTIGHSRRDAGNGNQNPGPAAYTPKYQESSPQFSIKMKLEERQKATQPVSSMQGPADYSPNTSQILEKTRIPIIGSEQKLTRYGGFNIGPGAYKLKSEVGGPRYSFSRSVRRIRPEDSSVPGPGQYTIPTTVANVPSYVKLNK